MGLKQTLKPFIKRFFRGLGYEIRPLEESLSETQETRHYWNSRYQKGGTSGPGSYGENAAYKAQFINAFVDANHVESVIEFGCGDGAQLSLATYPSYIGLDISHEAIALCKQNYEQDKSCSFYLYQSGYMVDNHQFFKADLALSLEVIFHLLEDTLYQAYMVDLFRAAERFVIIFSSNGPVEGQGLASHVRHHAFTEWIATHQPDWELLEHRPTPEHLEMFSDFFVYGKRQQVSNV